MDYQYTKRSPLLLFISIANLLAAAIFLALLLILPLTSQLSARSRFTQLDREGVINTDALAKFHPSYGFGNIAELEYRRTVPDYITESALSGQRMNALLALACTTANALAWAYAWRQSKYLRPSASTSD